MVKTLVTLHLRRRLTTLSSALLRAASLCDDEPGSQSRRILAEASDECRAFAEIFPRRGLLAVMATIATVAATVLTIVGSFLLLPHIPLNWRAVGQYMPVVVAALLVFAVAPVRVFFNSVRWKRAMFKPPSTRSGDPMIESTASVKTDWDVYKLEHEAFGAVKAPEQDEWESRHTIRWLVGAIYSTAIAIGLGYLLPLPTVIILSVSTVWFAVVKTYRWQRRIRAMKTALD